jgi:hypothetical protein
VPSHPGAGLGVPPLGLVEAPGHVRQHRLCAAPDAERLGHLVGVFRTYFINSRGDEAMGTTWTYLDMTALGRQEEWEDSPEGYPQTPPYQWWNWHDEYSHVQPPAST